MVGEGARRIAEATSSTSRAAPRALVHRILPGASRLHETTLEDARATLLNRAGSSDARESVAREVMLGRQSSPCSGASKIAANGAQPRSRGRISSAPAGAWCRP